MSEDTRDISMVDVSNALDEVLQTPRRKSTLILTEEDQDHMKVDHSKSDTNSGASSEPEKFPAESTDVNDVSPKSLPGPDVTVPVEIRWTQGGEKVYVTGSFTGWRKMIGLARQADNSFLITLGLPIGTHRFRFVIDNELRFSDYLPTATDQMGNFVNYVEVTPENVRLFLEQQEQQSSKIELDNKSQEEGKPSAGTEPALRKGSVSISRSTRQDSMWGLTNDDDDMGNGYSRYHDEDDGDDTVSNKNYDYITDIPPIFIDPKVMEQYYIAIEKQSKSSSQQAWLHPPQLPPHLENVILNNFNSMDKDNNSGALPIPNHVVLNHLATTSIKHNTLSVASVVRYKRKYVTQVLYSIFGMNNTPS